MLRGFIIRVVGCIKHKNATVAMLLFTKMLFINFFLIKFFFFVEIKMKVVTRRDFL